MESIDLQDLKSKSPADLLAYAEELEIENASTLRKQDMMFAILKQLAADEVSIVGGGSLEVLPDGFGFLRSPEANTFNARPGSPSMEACTRSVPSGTAMPMSFCLFLG